MYNPNTIIVCNRAMKRKVEKYQRSHPGLTFTKAYNKVYGTNFDEPNRYSEATCIYDNKRRKTNDTRRV